MTVYPDPAPSANPYPEPVVVPYTPEDPDLPEPVDAPPPPQREHLTANEAIARLEEQKQAAVGAPQTEPPMVTAYKNSML